MGILFLLLLVLKTAVIVLSLLEVMISEIGGVMMTENQKNLIKIYREKGMSYKEIARELSVSINTIKTYCKRNGLGGVRTGNAPAAKEKMMVTACEYCGKPVSQNKGRKQKRFCSDSCRNQWWNTHMDSVERKANYECVCEYCGKTFLSYGNKSRKYCSHSCYISNRFGGGENAGE